MKSPKLLTIVLGLDLQIYTSYIHKDPCPAAGGSGLGTKKAYAAVVLQILHIM